VQELTTNNSTVFAKINLKSNQNGRLSKVAQKNIKIWS